MAYAIDPGVLREYDIRGTVGHGLDADAAHAIGRSFATRVRRAGGRRIAVGYDGRLSSPMLEAALVDGLTASGADVVRIGLGPSPMLYFAEWTLGVDAAVQVTGSHNPADQNGFKLVLGHRSFFGPDIVDLARLAAAGDWLDGAGQVTTANVQGAYVARLLAGHTGGTYRIGWDTGNGASGPVVAALTLALPGEHHLLHTAVDGRFPNHHPDPTVAGNLADLQRLVLERGLDFGVAFDGDGDRLGAVDGRGRPLWGDQLLAILAAPVLADHPGATIVADVKSSSALFDRIAALGGRPVMGKTGHAHVKTKLHEEHAPLAGELSGHIFYAAPDWYGFDDAHFAAIRLIGALHRAGYSLAASRDALPATLATPELRIPVDGDRKAAIVAAIGARLTARQATVNRTDGLRVTTPDGWWLLRASNTQDMLTVRAEAADPAGLDRLTEGIEDELAREGIAFPPRGGR